MKGETILIDFYEPDLEVIEALPEKIVLYDNYIEFFSKNKYHKTDEDTGAKIYCQVDAMWLVLKKYVASVKMGLSEDGTVYLVKVYYLDRHSSYTFATKAKAKELYLKLLNWITT